MATYSSAIAMTIKVMSRSGLDLTPLSVSVQATHGNKFWNNGKTFLMITNGSGGDVVVTIDTPNTVDGLAITDKTITIATGQTYAIGPFTGDYNQSDGYVWFYCDVVTTVTAEAISL